MMKKVIFYGAMVGISIVIWLMLGALFALIFNGTNHFSYNFGAWCARPYIMLLAIGIALFFRGVFYKAIFKESKKYGSKLPLNLIAAAVIWGGWMIGIKALYEHAEANALNEYEQSYQKP